MSAQMQLSLVESRGLRTCSHELCGQPFQPPSHRHRYCSPSCQREAQKRREKAQWEAWSVSPTCKHDPCGKPFERSAAGQKYCSSSCMYAARARRNELRKAEIYTGQSCPTCGSEFRPKYHQKYCTAACRHEALKKRRLKPITCLLDGCDKTFRRLKGRGHKMYCSKECKQKAANFQERERAEKQKEVKACLLEDCSNTWKGLPLSNRKLYCSIPCREEAMRRRRRKTPNELVCANDGCNEVFNNGKAGTRKYCSLDCRKQVRRRRIRRLPTHYVTINGRQEHRLVMESVIGRALKRSENVHHLNGDRADNRPDNLELWTKAQPAGQRVRDKLGWCREFLAEYGDLADRMVI